MSAGYGAQPPESRAPRGRQRAGRVEDAELLLPPEASPVQLSRSMFSQPVLRPAPAPLTNQHLKKVARMDEAAIAADGGGDGGSGGGGGGGGRIRARSARSTRSAAASSVRGARKAFSAVSDEEVIDVDGAPTTLADDEMHPPPLPEADDEDDYNDDGADADDAVPQPHPLRSYPAAHAHAHAPYGHGGGLVAGGVAGLGGAGGVPDEGPDPLEELEADTPAVRLAEVNADLEAEVQGAKDPWVMVHLAQLALGHAKVVWRTMPVAVREEPLMLAKAHFALARAYQAHGCDQQASEHGKQALAVIPPELANTEAARALTSEVQVMRAEALLSSATAAGAPPESAANLARKALAQLVRAAGLQEPVAWTQEEVDENDIPGHVQRSTIDKVTDMGIVALMAQCHGITAEARLRAAEDEKAGRASALRSAEECVVRQERRSDRGDPFYSPEQIEKYKMQEAAFREEADRHLSEIIRLAGAAERSFDAAMYCLNHVIDVEGRRLEEAEDGGREAKVAHPTFRALWRRSLDFMAGMTEAYALQGKAAEQLSMTDEILAAFASYGPGGWLPPARHMKALKDKGLLLVIKRDYDGALEAYDALTDLVAELYAEDVVRREVQGAEVLKLRGDVALAAGDFRGAQHLFNQALDFYTRHLGPHSGVAQDLLHRIDEVKAYLADARVMGRLASFQARSGGGAVGGGSSGGGAAISPAASPKAGSVAASRASGARSSQGRPASTLGLAAPSVGAASVRSVSGGSGGGAAAAGVAGSVRVSVDDLGAGGAAADGGALSPVSTAAPSVAGTGRGGLLPAIAHTSSLRRTQESMEL